MEPHIKDHVDPLQNENVPHAQKEIKGHEIGKEGQEPLAAIHIGSEIERLEMLVYSRRLLVKHITEKVHI